MSAVNSVPGGGVQIVNIRNSPYAELAAWLEWWENAEIDCDRLPPVASTVRMLADARPICSDEPDQRLRPRTVRLGNVIHVRF